MSGLQGRRRAHGCDTREVLDDHRTKLLEQTISFLRSVITTCSIVNFDKVDPADRRSPRFENLIDPAGCWFISIEPG